MRCVHRVVGAFTNMREISPLHTPSHIIKSVTSRLTSDLGGAGNYPIK